MAITWSCSCGKSFNTEATSAGAKLRCPRCGKTNIIPAVEGEDDSAAIVAQKKAASPPILEVEPIDDDVIEIVPETEVEPLEEEDEIPEMDVEEEVAAWDKEKKRLEPPKKPKKPTTPKDISDPFEVEATVEIDPESEEGKFATRLAAAPKNAWAPIGSIKLADVGECVAYGPGGAYGLVGQDDDVLVVNMLKGKKLDRFGGHEGVVTSIAMSITGDCAISGDNEGDVIYWEIATRKRRRLLRDHESTITAVAIAPTSEWAVSGDREGSTRLWKLITGEEEALADSDWPEKITAVAFSTDSTLVASASNRGRVVVWSVKKGTAIHRYRLNSPAICSLQFGPKNEMLIAVSKPEESVTPVLPVVWRLDLRNGRFNECMRAVDTPRSYAYLATLDHGGRRLVCIGRAVGDKEYFRGLNVAEIWSIATGQRVHISGDLKSDVECLSIAPNNQRLVASLAKRQLQVFAMPDREGAVPLPDDPIPSDDRVRR
jgi:WD domain, G-beta repeat